MDKEADVGVCVRGRNIVDETLPTDLDHVRPDHVDKVHLGQGRVREEEPRLLRVTPVSRPPVHLHSVVAGKPLRKRLR